MREFDRLEQKFFLPARRAEAFLSACRKHALPDVHGDRGRYWVSSLYYDTPTLDIARRGTWNPAEAQSAKLRIRCYGWRTVMVELKQKRGDRSEKRRVPMRLQDALALCRGTAAAESLERDRAFAQQVRRLTKTYRMRPTCLVKVHRAALTDPSSDLRLTVDREMRVVGARASRFKEQRSELGAIEEGSSTPLLSGRLSIVEVKSAGAPQPWVTELLNQFDARPVPFSKYEQGMKALGALQRGPSLTDRLRSTWIGLRSVSGSGRALAG